MQKSCNFKLKERLHIILLKGVLFRGKFHLDFISIFTFYHFNIYFFLSFNNKSKRKLER